VERAISTPCKGQGGWSVAPCWILIIVSSGPVVHPLLYLFAFTSRFTSRSLVFVFGCLLGSAPPRSLFRGTLYHSRSLEPIGPSKTDNDEVPHRLGGSFGPGIALGHVISTPAPGSELEEGLELAKSTLRRLKRRGGCSLRRVRT